MRIDVHAHVFRPAAAQRLVEEISARIGVPAAGSGLVEDLIARERAAGIDRAVVLYAPPKPAMIRMANRFAVAQQQEHPDLFVFGSVHPHSRNWEEELDFLRHAGIRGLKLHPEYQNYRLDDTALLPLLKAAAPHFIFLCHMGGLAPGASAATTAAAPHMLAAILDLVPDMRFIAAHLGGHYLWEEALEHLAGRNVWLDTSASVRAAQPATLAAIFRRHDPEKILFGSDYPFFDPAAEVEALSRRLPPAMLDMALTNASLLLGLPR